MGYPTRPGFAPYISLLLFAAIAAASYFWLRAAETPVWDHPQASRSPSPPPPGPSSREKHTDFTPFNFVSYNVKNWLVSSQTPEKSPEAKTAVIQLLANAEPDVIGLCEVGSVTDVKEIQSLLKHEGIDLPHLHHTGGVDRIRHLALLSRFPIISREKPELRIRDERFMQRGILDVTLDTGTHSVRFIGLHLKSKRPVPEFDQAEMRIEEASHVRRHLDAILAAEPQARIIAYGDFNDSTRSISSRAIYGSYRSPGYMAPVHVKDTRGETWTHRYAVEDSYTRIDFVTVSRSLNRHAKRNLSRIIDDPVWETASDHRPVFVRFE